MAEMCKIYVPVGRGWYALHAHVHVHAHVELDLLAPSRPTLALSACTHMARALMP